MRRSLLCIEEGIWHGAEWAVFEPNDAPQCLKAKGRAGAIMNIQFRHEGLVGEAPEKADFAGCDADTMTQDDTDNGNVILDVGFAPPSPAEFVIFGIQQLAGRRVGSGGTGGAGRIPGPWQLDMGDPRARPDGRQFPVRLAGATCSGDGGSA